jgi:RNA polymerase sigma factor (sigma-70 family)
MEASPETQNPPPTSAAGARMLSVQPDAVLCARAARGNEDAFAVLFNRYRQQVFAFVYHLLGSSGNVHDAEDLTQEIMQKAYANASTQRVGGSFKAWLFRIARNHTFDHIRARRPEPLSIDSVDHGPEPSNVVSLTTEIERRAEFAWLIAALAELPERQREALVLRELGGASVEEIAEVIETSPEAAKQLVKRARSAINQAAREQGVRAGAVDRKLAAAAPITAITWLGAGKASAAASSAVALGGAATGGAVAAGGATAAGAAAGAAASGAGVALVAGKVAATALAVAAIGAGGIVAGERVSGNGERPGSAQKADGPGTSGTETSPTRSLTVGTTASERAKRNKLAANERRARARRRAAERKTRAKKRRAAARAKAKAHGRPNHAGGNGNAGGRSNERSGGGSGKTSPPPQQQQNSGSQKGTGPPADSGTPSGKSNGGGSNASGGNGKGNQ